MTEINFVFNLPPPILQDNFLSLGNNITFRGTHSTSFFFVRKSNKKGTGIKREHLELNELENKANMMDVFVLITSAYAVMTLDILKKSNSLPCIFIILIFLDDFMHVRKLLFHARTKCSSSQQKETHSRSARES